MSTHKKLSEYTVKDALDEAGLVEGTHYNTGNFGMGVAALAITKQASREDADKANAELTRIRKELDKALAALRRVRLDDESIPFALVQPIAEARDRLREAGARNE